MGKGPLPGADDPTSSPTDEDDDALFPPDDDDAVPTSSPTKKDGMMDDDLANDNFFEFDGRYLQNQGKQCGTNVCGRGEYCCNESCSICAPDGDFCIMLECDGAGVSVQLLGGSSFVVSLLCIGDRPSLMSFRNIYVIVSQRSSFSLSFPLSSTLTALITGQCRRQVCSSQRWRRSQTPRDSLPRERGS